VNTGRSQEAPASRPGPEVHSITGAATPHSDDMDARIRRYLISMAIRTACVVLAFVVHGPTRWVFLVGAVGLPYIAVVMANVATGQRRTAVPKVDAQPLTGLSGGTPTDRTMNGETVSAQTFYHSPTPSTTPDPPSSSSPPNVTVLTDGTRIDLTRTTAGNQREPAGHGSHSSQDQTVGGAAPRPGQTWTEPTSRPDVDHSPASAERLNHGSGERTA
jgi:hypothetical protein